MPIEAVIRGIIIERLDLLDAARKLGNETRLFGSGAGSLDLDSLASLEILAGLSERFDMPFDDIEAGDFRSITTLAAYVRRCGISDDNVDR